MSFFARLSLKVRLLAVITFLGMLPIAGAALTYMALQSSQTAEDTMDAASQGTIHLARINGNVFEVVMESRGIYMSPDWKTAEPYGRGLLASLETMRKTAELWRGKVVEGEQANVAALAAEIEKFAQFRTELVRLAREQST